MPYIDPQRRDVLEHPWAHAKTTGELNYELTLVALSYLGRKGLSYQACADIVSAFENAKHEFQRRIQDPYEDLKIEENGDVYPSFEKLLDGRNNG